MATQGTATVDFGAYPGMAYTTIAVTGQASILAGSLVEAWVHPANTTDHTADEHIIDPPRVIAGDIVEGVGFTIHAFDREQIRIIDRTGERNPFAVNSNPALPWGKWNIAWVWN